MFHLRNVLFATDFSHYALYALNYAVAIARQEGGVVHVAHVLDANLYSSGSGLGVWLTNKDMEKLLDSMQEHAESRLTHLVSTIQASGVAEAQHHILRGNAAAEICQHARQLDVDVIVLATHGRTGFDHVVFGSVAEKVVRQSQLPVLCVKHPEHEFIQGADQHLRIRRVLFPTDFSDYSDQSLNYAVALCQQFDATLLLFHACEVPMVLPEFMPDTVSAFGADLEANAIRALEKMQARVEGCEVEIITKAGIPYREISHVVAERDIDLVVMPTHGRSGFAHALFGSVAERVVRLAPCPVLTIRPDAADKTAPEAGLNQGAGR